MNDTIFLYQILFYDFQNTFKGQKNFSKIFGQMDWIKLWINLDKIVWTYPQKQKSKLSPQRPDLVCTNSIEHDIQNNIKPNTTKKWFIMEFFLKVTILSLF